MKKAQRKKELKQTSLGNFFSKGNESSSSLWNTVDNDIEEHRKNSNGLKASKVTATSRTPGRSKNSLDSTHLIPNSPAIVPRKRSLLARNQVDSLLVSSLPEVIDLELNSGEEETGESLVNELSSSPVNCSKASILRSKKAFTNLKQFDKKDVETSIDEEKDDDFKKDSLFRLKKSPTIPDYRVKGKKRVLQNCEREKTNDLRQASDLTRKDHRSSYFDTDPSKGKFSLCKETKKRSFDLGSSGLSPIKKKQLLKKTDPENQISKARNAYFVEEHSSTVKSLTSLDTESKDTKAKISSKAILDQRPEIPKAVVGESGVICKAASKKYSEEVTQFSNGCSVQSPVSLKLTKKKCKKSGLSVGESLNRVANVKELERISNNNARDGLLDDANDFDLIASYGRSGGSIFTEHSTNENGDEGQLNPKLANQSGSSTDCHRKEMEDYATNCADDSFSEVLADLDMSIENSHFLSSKQIKSKSNHADERRCDIDKTGTIDMSDSILNISLDSDFDCLASSPQTKDLEKDTTVKTVLVLEVLRQEVENCGSYKPEKILRLFDEETSQEATCIMREDWESLEVSPGDTAHITDYTLQPGETLVLDNNSQKYLVLFPDTLVSGTTISLGITCQRRAVLSELFKTDGPNEVMFLGTFLHELFDYFIQGKDFRPSVLEQLSSELVARFDNLNTLYSLDIDYRSFMDKVREMSASLSRWARKFMKAEPSLTDDVIDFKRGSQPLSDTDVRLSVSDVVDIEENILCPSLGLKGKIDASVNVRIHRDRKGSCANNKSSKLVETYLLPFELKTGRMFTKLGSIEHRAQVILYTLMMSEKHGKEIDAGLLYYLKAGHLQGVPATLKEKRSLIIKRNELARYLSKENQRSALSLPGLLRNERNCKRCPAVKTCMVFHKAVEQGTKETSGIGEMFEEITAHLTEEELEYLVKWYRLLMLEAQEEFVSNAFKDMWTKSSEERERKGRCFSMMTVKAESKKGESLWTYIFHKSENQARVVSLCGLSLAAGDRVVISEENCKTYGLCIGYILSVSDKEVCIQCKERIRPRNDLYESAFRIEKDESLSGQKIPLGNLMKLMLSSTETDTKLRRLIIDFEAPKFSLVRERELLGLTGGSRCAGTTMLTGQNNGQKYLVSDSSIKEIAAIFRGLNPDQAKAVTQCLSAEDYVIILGMPGTGKTTTIACIVKILTLLGKSVMVASYTHSAVDNILLKLNKMKLDFIRLGNRQSVHEEIRPFLVDEATKDIKSIEELHHFYHQKNIVATTCLGINHPLFLKKRFDYCIVDEASQITQPVCFGAVRNADVFVLVGDHYQLPPLVQNVEARHSGMDISLFRLLSEKHPSAIASLRFQYRMHRDIMSLANSVVYGHRMQCGDEKIATAELRLSIKNGITRESGQLLRVIDPKHPVVFINTDSIPCPESIAGKHIQNEGEASILSQIVHGLLQCGIDSSDIGVISPLRNQLKVIKERLVTSLGRSRISGVEINTVDKYQGRDKSCIIVSFVRSNNRRQVGEILKDWRRVNVAVTRAKHKLIMIGSKETLSQSPFLRKLIELAETRNWMESAENSLVNCLQLK